jgi:hypothetical protein
MARHKNQHITMIGAWIRALAIITREVGACFFGARFAWRQRRRLSQLFAGLTRPVRVLAGLVAPAGASLAIGNL